MNEETGEVTEGTSSLEMAVGAGSYSKVGALHHYGADEDWSGYGGISIWLYGQNTGYTRNLGIWASDSSNKLEYAFVDDWSGWSRMVVSFGDMQASGSPDLAAVRRVYTTIVPGGVYDWYIDLTELIMITIL